LEDDVPALRAPALRALGQYEEGLEAFEAWVEEDPESVEARSGRAWMNFYLFNNEEAEEQFRALSGSNALYGRALLANRAGDLSEAVDLLYESGDADYLWLATDLLERDERYDD